MNTIATIVARVRAGVKGESQSADSQHPRDLIQAEIAWHNQRALAGKGQLINEAIVREEVLAELTGFGALQPLLDDPSIEEIWINSPDSVFVARAGIPERIALLITHQQLDEIVERMLRSSGRRLDATTPFVDASLPDGSRLHVVIPDIVRSHKSINIRKFMQGSKSLEYLQNQGSISAEAAEYLRSAIRQGASVLVAGATQAGKTTLLNALLNEAPESARQISCEETFELTISRPDVVAMQCRQPSIEGTGEVTLRQLIREAMRMRPDRIVIGEVRGAECLDLLIALNAGLPAGCTVHANSAQDALDKLCTLPLLAGGNISRDFVVQAVARCIDLVVFCALGADGKRSVIEIARPVYGSSNASEITAEAIFVRDDRGELTRC
ncbi:MAG: CpaF family protein [Microbacteriaceae bacterium]|nr:CpaF family protein [Microbacteriaceae bacterium]